MKRDGHNESYSTTTMPWAVSPYCLRIGPRVSDPFVIDQAFRSKYLDQALDHIANYLGVWLTTSDEIAEHFIINGG